MKRTFEEILKDYNVAIEDSTMSQVSERVYAFANQPLRNELQLEADELLSEDKKLAIFLHKKLCKENHTDSCSWYYSVKGLIHDWSNYSHEEYLQMAQNMLKATNNMNLEDIKRIFECIR